MGRNMSNGDESDVEPSDVTTVRESGTEWYDAQHEECMRDLAALRAALAHSRDDLSVFAGQVSHDLRTPLTAILANAEMLSFEPTVAADPDLGWMVEGISRAAQRMNTMIEQMLAYARDGGAPALTETHLGRVFELALDDLAPVIADKQAKVTVGPLPMLTADADQMYDVALNLLSNALKFSHPDRQPEVEVRAQLLADRWRVSVTDNGIGVPAERQDAMFVLFARADKRIDGSGIGLASAKRFVEGHGGRIGMESAPGGGTTVWFDLPA